MQTKSELLEDALKITLDALVEIKLVETPPWEGIEQRRIAYAALQRVSEAVKSAAPGVIDLSNMEIQ